MKKIFFLAWISFFIGITSFAFSQQEKEPSPAKEEPSPSLKKEQKCKVQEGLLFSFPPF